MNALVARIIGEAVPVDDQTELENPEDTGGEPSTSQQYVNPTVENLVKAWESGNHDSVALRILDSLDLYEDFVEVLFRLGHENAVLLASIMDEMTVDQKSDNAFAEQPDEIAASHHKSRAGSPTKRHAIARLPIRQ